MPTEPMAVVVTSAAHARSPSICVQATGCFMPSAITLPQSSELQQGCAQMAMSSSTGTHLAVAQSSMVLHVSTGGMFVGGLPHVQPSPSARGLFLIRQSSSEGQNEPSQQPSMQRPPSQTPERQSPPLEQDSPLRPSPGASRPMASAGQHSAPPPPGGDQQTIPDAAGPHSVDAQHSSEQKRAPVWP